jgi:hypothetical protein
VSFGRHWSSACKPFSSLNILRRLIALWTRFKSQWGNLDSFLYNFIQNSSKELSRKFVVATVKYLARGQERNSSISPNTSKTLQKNLHVTLSLLYPDWGIRVFLFTATSRIALGSNQCPSQRVLEPTSHQVMGPERDDTYLLGRSLSIILTWLSIRLPKNRGGHELK